MDARFVTLAGSEASELILVGFAAQFVKPIYYIVYTKIKRTRQYWPVIWS
jgi:hypothetical protein